MTTLVLPPQRDDWLGYLRQFPERLLLTPEGRREACRFSPYLFALIYLRHHLKSAETSGNITFSDFHLDFYQQAKQWARDDFGPGESRECWVAPRSSGKSTLAFLAAPLWALAYGHRKFVAAFADSGPQAQQHLASFKRELDTNELLRLDFPELCTPAYRPGGQNVADNQALYIAKSGVAFMAKGIDSSTLGAKVGSQRPDLILFDDVEPDKSNYSLYQKDKRLSTIINAVLPMNLNAVVVMVGTVTMAGSIVHDMVRTIIDPAEAPTWPGEENFRVRYYPALVRDGQGEWRSMWESRWSTAYLLSIRNTASYKLNYENNPEGMEGALLSAELMRDRRWWAPNPEPETELVAVAVDPSGGKRDTAGIIGGLLGTDRRLYLTDDATVAGPVEVWTAAACELAWELEADRFVVESNFGAGMAERVMRSAWEALCRRKGSNRPCPRIVMVHSKRGKVLRAEPVVQAWIDDQIRMLNPLPNVEKEWSSWTPGGAESPGRIDASVHLALQLLPIPGAGALVSTPVSVSRSAAGVGGGSRVERGPRGGSSVR